MYYKASSWCFQAKRKKPWNDFIETCRSQVMENPVEHGGKRCYCLCARYCGSILNKQERVWFDGHFQNSVLAASGKWIGQYRQTRGCMTVGVMRHKATGQGGNKKCKKTEWNHTVNKGEGMGEMAQRLGKETALTEGMSLSPSTYTGKPSTTWDSGSKGSDALFWPQWAPALLCAEPLPDSYSNTYRKTKQSLKGRGRLAKSLDA